MVDSVLSESMLSSPTVDTISYNLQQSLNPGQVMTDLLFNTKKLQHRLSEKQSKSQVQQMIRGSKTKDAARLLSLQGKGAGAWIDYCIPSSQRFALSPGLYRLATFVRLGLPVPFTRFGHKVRVWKAPRPRGLSPHNM